MSVSMELPKQSNLIVEELYNCIKVNFFGGREMFAHQFKIALGTGLKTYINKCTTSSFLGKLAFSTCNSSPLTPEEEHLLSINSFIQEKEYFMHKQVVLILFCFGKSNVHLYPFPSIYHGSNNKCLIQVSS